MDEASAIDSQKYFFSILVKIRQDLWVSEIFYETYFFGHSEKYINSGISEILTFNIASYITVTIYFNEQNTRSDHHAIVFASSRKR